MDCVLNRPTCKRTIMDSKGPYINEKCPLAPSNQPTCMLAQQVCPLLPQDTTCPLTKIMEISKAGGCFANVPPPPPPPPQNQCCCCCCCCCPREKEEEPVNPFVSCRTDKYVQLPPCQRCRKGYKVEEDTTKQVKEKKEQRRLTHPRQSTTKHRQSTTSPKSKVPLKSGIEGECTLNSRRPFPCSECLMDLLDCTLPPTEYDSSKVYCKARAVKCPFTQVIDICDENCFCIDIPDIDTGPPCPFAPKPCPCCTAPRCPMTRVPPCPLVERIRPPQCMKPKCRCFCPTVPNPCSITYVECPMHSGLMKNQCPLGQAGGPSVCPATIPPICCCPPEKPSPIEVEVSQEFEVKGKRYTTGNANLNVDVSITDMRKPSAPVQELYQKSNIKGNEIAEKHKKEKKPSNPLKISKGVGKSRRKSKRKQDTLLLRNVERVHNKTSTFSKNEPDQIRISDWIEKVNCSLGTQAQVINNLHKNNSYFKMAFPKGNGVIESKSNMNTIKKRKNKLKHYPDLTNEEHYKHCTGLNVKQIVNKRNRRLTPSNATKDVKFVELSSTTFNKMLMAKALPPPTIYIGDINFGKKMDAPKFCKSPMSANHKCSCCLKVEGPKQKEKREIAASNQFVTQQSNKPNRYEEEYFYKLKSKIDDPHFKFLTEFCLCDKRKNENNFNQVAQDDIPDSQYKTAGIQPNVENNECTCLKPSGHKTCLCATNITDLGCVCEPVYNLPTCECEKKIERNSCPCERPSNSFKCGCDDCPYAPCPCGKNCPSKLLNTSKMVKTFHVPTCPQAKLTSLPKSSLKGEKVCPYAPNFCPLGGYCPFPVEASFDPSAPPIPKPNLICPCKPNKPNCFLAGNNLESQPNCPLSPIKPLSIKEKPVCAFDPYQLGCKCSIPDVRPNCPFAPLAIAPLPVFQNCPSTACQRPPCCCGQQQSRPICPLSSMAQNSSCFCGNTITQEPARVSVQINTNVGSKSFDFKTEITDNNVRKNRCNCCPCSNPLRNVCQCNQKPKIKCPLGLEDCPCTHLTETNACPLNAIECPVQRPICPLPTQLRSSLVTNTKKTETVEAIPKETENILKEVDITRSLSRQSTMFVKEIETISNKNETSENVIAKEEDKIEKRHEIKQEKPSEKKESIIDTKEKKEVTIREGDGSISQRQSVSFSETFKVLSTDLLNTKYAKSMEGSTAGKQALAFSNVIKSLPNQKNLNKTRLIAGGIRVSPPQKINNELISDILSIGTTLSKKRSRLISSSVHHEVHQALINELNLKPEPKRKSIRNSKVGKTTEKNMPQAKLRCLLEPPECPLTGALPSVIAYSGLVKPPGEHLPPPKEKEKTTKIDRSNCTIDKLMNKSKNLDCPLMNPPCVMFPEGKCPMKEMGACDCNYPVAPCMLPAQCGDVFAPPQYCYKEDCCMGLTLPPTYPAEHGKYETGAYYKFLDWKPGSATTKHYVDVSINPPPLTFFKGHPERVHDNWSIIRGGKGYEQCKKVQEIIEARGPVGEVGTQFDKRDNPLDEETILVLENRKNREKLKREAEKPSLEWA